METPPITRPPSPIPQHKNEAWVSDCQAQLEKIRERVRNQPTPTPSDLDFRIGIATFCCPVVLAVVGVWIAKKVKGD